jgi:hypothetical protein
MKTGSPFWRRRGPVIVILLLPALWIASLLLPRAWSSNALHGYVAAPDGRAIAGAHVVVTWDAVAYWSNSGAGILHAAEAVTDSQGRFSIPSWSGKYIEGGTMQGSEPTTRVFKKGFVPLVLPNPSDNVLALAKQHVVYGLEGRTLTLSPFSGTDGDYALALQSFRHDLYRLRAHRPADACVCRQMPHMLRALEAVREELARAGVAEGLGDVPGCCGSK